MTISVSGGWKRIDSSRKRIVFTADFLVNRLALALHMNLDSGIVSLGDFFFSCFCAVWFCFGGVVEFFGSHLFFLIRCCDGH